MILGTWWGYADGNRTLVGAVVIIILVAALGFVAHRVIERRREARRQRPDASGRMAAQSGRFKRPSAAQSGRFKRR
jgi:hypothetical protein